MAQVRPEEKLSAAEEGHEPEEAGPVVLEQGDVSGGLGEGAEAAAANQLFVSYTQAVCVDENPAAQTCNRGLCRHRRILKDLLMNISQSKLSGATFQCPA